MIIISALLFSSLNIYLNTDNSIYLYGDLTNSIANDISYKINQVDRSNKYLIINSQGKGTEAVAKNIITQVNMFSVPCIALETNNLATSVFLNCAERYILYDTVIYKSNFTFLSNELNKLLNVNEGIGILKRLASNLVTISCASDLLDSNITRNNIIYSKCPNIKFPLKKISNEKNRCEWMGCN